MGQHWEKAGQWEKAMEFFHRGLEMDELAEEFYQCLMTCYSRLGRKAEAMAVYRRCRKTLSTALGVEPSSKTEAIYKTLLSKLRNQGSKGF